MERRRYDEGGRSRSGPYLILALFLALLSIPTGSGVLLAIAVLIFLPAFIAFLLAPPPPPVDRPTRPWERDR